MPCQPQTGITCCFQKLEWRWVGCVRNKQCRISCHCNAWYTNRDSEIDKEFRSSTFLAMYNCFANSCKHVGAAWYTYDRIWLVRHRLRTPAWKIFRNGNTWKRVSSTNWPLKWEYIILSLQYTAAVVYCIRSAMHEAELRKDSKVICPWRAIIACWQTYALFLGETRFGIK